MVVLLAAIRLRRAVRGVETRKADTLLHVAQEVLNGIRAADARRALGDTVRVRDTFRIAFESAAVLRSRARLAVVLPPSPAVHLALGANAGEVAVARSSSRRLGPSPSTADGTPSTSRAASSGWW